MNYESWIEKNAIYEKLRWTWKCVQGAKCSMLLSGEPDYFGRNKISSGGDLSHYSSASLY